ncbi:hypothetical protein GPECTOR_62g918 [Gonium pectorale]|uniref:DNA2/NAM7 helicase-like C-terminal domain-containing protein n=1 Tax=Gonium pectorale TaxID=33097 RepID=A0A150G4U8_GONPE|nr:hypothetical protein GPECTOR_62g918 [Gonium pectorale]|eukprot:KXZ44803.1 hypothetical protein GPECTOR_62g918 [Gonium pectorale]
MAATAVADLVCKLIKSCAAASEHDVGIICTYRQQVFKLRQLLRDRDLGRVRVGTVDDYQGQEERIVFISTVLSRPESLPSFASSAASAHATASAASSSQPLGLWSHPKRFNVAVTRSRALLVVVGHPAVLLADRYWRELVRQCVASVEEGEPEADDAWEGTNGNHHDGYDGYDGYEGDGDGDGDDEYEFPDAADLASVVEQLAEMATLGMGCEDSIYPDPSDLHRYYDEQAAYYEEQPFRVQL